MSGATQGLNDLYAQSEMYPYFIALFMTGCFFLFLALWFLPFIVVAPRKCANLINVGAICILSSFAVIKGAYQFFITDMLCHPTKWFFAWTYLVSMICTLYASMVLKNYILTLIALGIEVVCLLYFICSYFPGGTKGMKYMLNFTWTGIKKLFKCCIGE